METDPSCQMEIFNIMLSWDKPTIEGPEELTRELTVDLVKKANDQAFEVLKKEYMMTMIQDPMIMPLLISSLAHDWVYANHKWTEEQFKASLFHHKIYEDPQIAQHMQMKQYELMMMAQNNPMMMQMMGGM